MFKKTPLLMAIAMATAVHAATPTKLNLYRHTTVLPDDHFKFLLNHNLISFEELGTLLRDGKSPPSIEEQHALIKTIDERYAIKKKDADELQKKIRSTNRSILVGSGYAISAIFSVPLIALAVAIYVKAHRQKHQQS